MIYPKPLEHETPNLSTSLHRWQEILKVSEARASGAANGFEMEKWKDSVKTAQAMVEGLRLVLRIHKQASKTYNAAQVEERNKSKLKLVEPLE